jgi:hypothetical protein
LARNQIFDSFKAKINSPLQFAGPKVEAAEKKKKFDTPSKSIRLRYNGFSGQKSFGEHFNSFANALS